MHTLHVNYEERSHDGKPLRYLPEDALGLAGRDPQTTTRCGTFGLGRNAEIGRNRRGDLSEYGPVGIATDPMGRLQDQAETGPRKLGKGLEARRLTVAGS